MERQIQITRIPRLEFHKTISELFDRRMGELLPAQIPLEKLSGLRVESVTIAPESMVPECVGCGACCGIAMVVHIPRDHTAEIGNVWEIELEDSPTGAVVARHIPRDRETGNCVYLEGQIGETVGCGIYENRPHTCREFDAGSDKCHEYRRMYGLEPQLSQEQIADVMPRLDSRIRPEKIIFVRIVRDSTGVTYSMLVDTEFYEPPARSEKLRIEVVMNDANYSQHEIHIYDPAEEMWLESDFLGLSLEKARELVASRGSESN